MRMEPLALACQRNQIFVEPCAIVSEPCRGAARGLRGVLEGAAPNVGAKRRLILEICMPSDAIQCKPLEVAVGDRGIERAIKHLKRKVATEGVLRELKMRRHYMKPSIKRRKKQAEAARRRRKRAKMDAAPRV